MIHLAAVVLHDSEISFKRDCHSAETIPEPNQLFSLTNIFVVVILEICSNAEWEIKISRFTCRTQANWKTLLGIKPNNCLVVFFQMGWKISEVLMPFNTPIWLYVHSHMFRQLKIFYWWPKWIIASIQKLPLKITTSLESWKTPIQSICCKVYE